MQSTEMWSKIATHVASGLSCLHSRGLCHASLHPCNVLINADNNAVLTDYGRPSRLLQLPALLATQLGPTPNPPAISEGALQGEDSKALYIAPEVAVQNSVLDEPAQGAMADVWSLGCLIVRLASQQPLYSSRAHGTAHQLLKEVACGNCHPSDGTLGAGVTVELAALIRDCAAVAPTARPRAAQVLGFLVEMAGRTRAAATRSHTDDKLPSPAQLPPPAQPARPAATAAPSKPIDRKMTVTFALPSEGPAPRMGCLPVSSPRLESPRLGGAPSSPGMLDGGPLSGVMGRSSVADLGACADDRQDQRRLPSPAQLPPPAQPARPAAALMDQRRLPSPAQLPPPAQPVRPAATAAPSKPIERKMTVTFAPPSEGPAPKMGSVPVSSPRLESPRLESPRLDVAQSSPGMLDGGPPFGARSHVSVADITCADNGTCDLLDPLRSIELAEAEEQLYKEFLHAATLCEPQVQHARKRRFWAALRHTRQAGPSSKGEGISTEHPTIGRGSHSNRARVSI